MKNFFLILILITLALIVACGGASQSPTAPPPTPTPLVYPATWTPEQAITLAPTETPIVPTRTPDAVTSRVAQAIERTRKLPAYYARLNMILTDPTGAVPGAIPGEPFSVMSLEGRLNQDDSQWRLGGLFIRFLGGDANKGIDFVTVGDKMYLRGPLPFFGAPEERWYVAPKQESGNFIAYLGPQGFLREFSATEAKFPAMRATAQGSLDNKPCTQYQGDERETMALFAVLDRNGQFTQRVGALDGVVQRAAMTVWVCEDGYVHQLDMGIFVKAKNDPTQEATLAIALRMYDMNILVPLTPPADAIPLSMPLLFPTPINSP